MKIRCLPRDGRDCVISAPQQSSDSGWVNGMINHTVRRVRRGGFSRGKLGCLDDWALSEAAGDVQTQKA